MSTDAQRIADITQYGTILWSGIFQMVLAFVSLYQLLGWQVSRISFQAVERYLSECCAGTDVGRCRCYDFILPHQRRHRQSTDTDAEASNEEQGFQDPSNERDLEQHQKYQALQYVIYHCDWTPCFVL
jgi:ATP-binding cassette subfamily C (CFTR/MRP) protein 1